MTLRPEIAAAYEQLDAAVANIVEAMAAFGDGTMLSGYAVVVTGVGFDDDPGPDDDEQNTVSRNRLFVKRGQSPVLTRGMVEYALDYLRES